VPDLRQYGHESDPESEMYVLYRQVPYYARAMTLVAETHPGAGGVEQVVRTAVRELDPAVAVEMGSLPARLSALTEERRLVLYGLGLFGGTALVLVCLGIYGLVSFAVEKRTRELAVRAALGADRGGIVSLVLGSALRVVLAGALVGLAGALALGRVLASMLVDVTTSDPTTYLASATLIVLVGLAAALMPSLRAARMDPLEALRRE
jgi:predicted lysophospholipase L1 biosynthesis ABC-type transport system permease subunit